MRIPEGTQLVLHASSTKPLTAARVHELEGQARHALDLGNQAEQKLRWEYGTLTADDVLIVSVTDADGVASREPYRVSLSAVKDDVPQVAVRLSGHQHRDHARCRRSRFVGKITDDYGLDRAWFEYQVDAGPVAKRPLAQQPHGEPTLDKARRIRHARDRSPKPASERSNSNRSSGSRSRSKRPTASTSPKIRGPAAASSSRSTS